MVDGQEDNPIINHHISAFDSGSGKVGRSESTRIGPVHRRNPATPDAALGLKRGRRGQHARDLYLLRSRGIHLPGYRTVDSFGAGVNVKDVDLALINIA